MKITRRKGLRKSLTGNVDMCKHVPQPGKRTQGSRTQASGQTRRTQEGQALYAVFNIPSYYHIEMDTRLVSSISWDFSCSCIRTDCNVISWFFGLPFDSCSGLVSWPLKQMKHSLQFLHIQTLIRKPEWKARHSLTGADVLWWPENPC